MRPIRKGGLLIRNENLRIAFLLFVFVFLINFATSAGINIGDGFPIFMTSRSIVLNHSFGIDQLDLKLFSFVSGKEIGSYSLGGNGKFYLLPGVLMSVLAAPLYYLGNLVGRIFFAGIDPELSAMFFFSLFNPLILSILCVAIFYYLRSNDYSLSKSIVWPLIFAFTTFAWPYAKTGFYEPLMAFILFSVYLFLFLYKKHQNLRFLLFSAIIFGLGLFAKLALIIFLPIFLLYLIMIFQRNIKIMLFSIVWFLGIYIFLLVLMVLYNMSIHSAPIIGGYSDTMKNDAFFVFNAFYFFNAFLGLLFSPGKGIIFYAPILLLFVFVYRRPLKEIELEEIICLSLFLVAVLFYSFFSIWSGGGAWGPRYLLPVLPFGLIVLAKNDYFRLKKINFLFVLSLVGFFVQFPACIVRWGGPVNAFFNLGITKEINFCPQLSPIVWAWTVWLTLIGKILKVAPNCLEIFLMDEYGVKKYLISINEVSKYSLWLFNAPEIYPFLWPLALVVFISIIVILVIVARWLFMGIKIEEI